MLFYDNNTADYLTTYYVGLRHGTHDLEPLTGQKCCVLGQDTSLSQCFSPPKSTWVLMKLVNCGASLSKSSQVACDSLTW